MSVLDTVLADPSAPAKASGLPVVGYLSNTAPVEMIRASGGFAQQVVGSPDDETPDALTILEDFFDGWALSVMQQLLDGRLAHLEALVIPRTSETNLQLYYHLQELRRQRLGANLPEPILFDLLQTPFVATERYNAGRLAALRERLARIAGTLAGDDALEAAIGEANAVRSALARLNARRVAGEVAGSVMWRAVRASTMMAPSDVLEAIGQVGRAKGGDGPRLLLTGSAYDGDGLHRLVEELGGSLTADDHGSGDWWFLDPVGPGRPMEALAKKYQHFAPSPRSYPPERCHARVLEAAERGRVDGAIFFYDSNDDCLGFDFPPQRDLLRARGIPVIRMEAQDYRAPDRAAQRAQLSGLMAEVGAREAVV